MRSSNVNPGRPLRWRDLVSENEADSQATWRTCRNIRLVFSNIAHQRCQFNIGRVIGCSTPKLSGKSEIFRLSEVLGCLSEIFITYL